MASDNPPDKAGVETASAVSLHSGLPETVLPAPPAGAAAALDAAMRLPPEERLEAFAEVAASDPAYLDAWAHLSGSARGPVEAYAYARVGYHRGLDALRAAGWRGSGYVRWEHPMNRGFLGALDALRRAAGEIGEAAEEERCALFLRQLDPGWPHEPGGEPA